MGELDVEPNTGRQDFFRGAIGAIVKVEALGFATFKQRGAKGVDHVLAIVAIEELAIDGPYGHAQLREDCPRDVVCVSGGSGISPMLSIARAMMASPRMAARKMHFFYGGRTERDICGEAELRELPGFGERLFYYPSLSMAEESDDWQGHCGFVHENVLATIAGVPAEFEYYFAGPPAMTQATQRMLMKNKVPLSQMHFDAFY